MREDVSDELRRGRGRRARGHARRSALVALPRAARNRAGSGACSARAGGARAARVDGAGAVRSSCSACRAHSNGKIDRRALPRASRRTRRSRKRACRRNELESQLAEMWRETLGPARVGVEDNFFDLGGHSLLDRAHPPAACGELTAEARAADGPVPLPDHPLAGAPPRLRESHARHRGAKPPARRRRTEVDAAAPASAWSRADRETRDDAPAPRPSRAERHRHRRDRAALPGAHGAAAVLVEPARGRRVACSASATRSSRRAACRARCLADPAYVKAGSCCEGMDLFDAGVLRLQPQGRRDPRSAAPPVPRVRLGGARGRRSPPADVRAARSACSAAAGWAATSRSTCSRIPALVESTGLFLLRHTGNDKDFLTTRVSYCLDLEGPSINVQTACSTSLVAVHARLPEPDRRASATWRSAGGVTIEIPHGRRLPVPGRARSSRPTDTAARSTIGAEGTVFGSGVRHRRPASARRRPARRRPRSTP